MTTAQKQVQKGSTESATESPKEAEQPTFTVVYFPCDLVGVYSPEGGLVATHDKFTKSNGDLERALRGFMDSGATVVETKSESGGKFSDIPEKLTDVVSKG